MKFVYICVSVTLMCVCLNLILYMHLLIHIFIFVVVCRCCMSLGCYGLSSEAPLLAKLANLYIKIFHVCPNGVVPSLKLQMALTALHASKPVYHSLQDSDDM